MKLISFHIINFGGLHNYDYEFNDGLNVILQDNGWGKTTMAAFLKAMLYGFDSKRSRDITENERKRYTPWQGGEYGGSLDFEADGVNYRVHRTFGATARSDKTRIVNLDTHTTAKIDPDKLGETLFNLDANAFQRSVYITQNGLNMDNAASSIHTRLNTLVSQANDVGAFDDAVNRLTQEIKIYEKTGARGKIGDLTRLINEKEHQRDRLESSINEQVEARKRLVEIDNTLKFLNRSLTQKKSKLENLTGEAKKKEAAAKLLKEINDNIAAIRLQMNSISRDFGGHIPTLTEVEKAKDNQRIASETAIAIEGLKNQIASLKNEYEALLGAYDGTLPTAKDIDEIQKIHGELQGILSTGEEVTKKEDAPAEYIQISDAIKTDADYTAHLKKVIRSQDTIVSDTHKLETKENEISSEKSSWDEKTKRFAVLHKELTEAEEELGKLKEYKPAVVDPVIRDLQKQEKEESVLRQQTIDFGKQIQEENKNWTVKRERYQSLKSEADQAKARIAGKAQYSSAAIKPFLELLTETQAIQQRLDIAESSLQKNLLTDEEAALLDEYENPEAIYAECKEFLQVFRDINSKETEIQSLNTILDGESNKAESLKASLAQYSSMDTETQVISEPVKPNSALLLLAGAVLLIAGVVLAFTVTIPLLVLAAIGLVLMYVGYSNTNKYQQDLRHYQEYTAQETQRNEARRKKKEIEDDLTASQNKTAELQNRIENLSNDAQNSRIKLNGWLMAHHQTADQPEEAIRQIMSGAEKAQNLEEQRKDNELARESIDADRKAVELNVKEVNTAYPETEGKSIAEAVTLLRDQETDYKVRNEQQLGAERNLKSFLAESKVKEEEFKDETSPLIAELTERTLEISRKLTKLHEERIAHDVNYPEIEGSSYQDAIETLQKKKSEYSVAKAKHDTAIKNESKFVKSFSLKADQLALSESPRLGTLLKEKEKIARHLEAMIAECNHVLSLIGLSLNMDNASAVLRKADDILRVYSEYDKTQRDSIQRVQRKQLQVNDLQTKLNEKEAILKDCYDDLELPDRLTFIRRDIQKKGQLESRINEQQNALTNAQLRNDRAVRGVNGFRAGYVHFTPETEDFVKEVNDKLTDYQTLNAALRQAESQKKTVIEQNQITSQPSGNEEEEDLRYQIQIDEKRRDDLRDEYTQKTDIIRQADNAASVYPDLTTEIHQLYEQKQKAQNRVSMLKHTIQLITKAKENLADRYLSKVEQLFNNYMHIWLENDAVKGILDIDFNVTIEENDTVHAAEGYSTGYCDLIDFCMRLALVDTLFEKEQPFLILDDPFVNLDSDRLNKALELIHIMGTNKQIIYFICHPIRAVETEIDDSARKEYVKLAESTRKMLESRKASPEKQKKSAVRSGKDRYQVDSVKRCWLELVKPGRTITNSIFSLDFKLSNEVTRDITYELFFIDEKGHVLNERQIIEVNDGKLSNSRIQFSLNTRDDSGKEYELMIKEAGQDDYTVTARIPFAAKIAFTGTFDFDF